MTKPLKRILMVDDDADVSTVAAMALEAVGGFEVQTCASGAEALAAAPDANADLVLLDVMMPGIDGPATLAGLRRIAATARTPVIFMTAKVQPHEVESYLALGAAGVIAKPFDPIHISDEIRQIWERITGQ